jgi:hypothetical protein
MELKIIKSTNNIGKEVLEILAGEAKVAICFGEDLGTGEVASQVNPMIDGLTCGTPNYDGIFILRNPENCNITHLALKEIPIYLDSKMKRNFEICCDFLDINKNVNIINMVDSEAIQIKNLEITSFIIDPSNINTHIIYIKDTVTNKSVTVCGDFKNYNGDFAKDKLDTVLNTIHKTDCIIVEGKYIGKYGLEYSSGKEILDRLKNIMKFYKQVFVIQSETDMVTTANMYEAAKKTKKIFIENTFLSNLTTLANGSAPNPITTKNVYSYNPLVLENEDFLFKKNYVTPFYINNAMNKMKKEKYVMNITKDMLQDIQVFEKEGSFYDACVIFSEWKGYQKQDKELEEFLNILKNFDMDYYELYTHGKVNMEILKKIIFKIKPEYVVPLDFENNTDQAKELYNFRVLQNNEVLDV